jgi:hypothetical protein
MIASRVEKLKFLVEEIQVAFHLTMHLTDPFVARTLARHILIRTENFIEHARGLRRPLNDAGYDTHDYHKAKEAYASIFTEYFKVSRGRLGAHVQDFDFGKRIELWNDIEIVKIGFFVDGAQELYRSLLRLSLPGYVPYTDPPELNDSAVLEALGRFQRAIDIRNWVEMGTDPLALTRNNTIATMNTTPVHARAGQLDLIRLWIAMEVDLLDRLAAHPRIVRILKARVITDLVSFCDCLVTRPVPSSAPQAMDGLDKLITASGQSSAPIDNFVGASNFLAELQTARAIRDTIGAHLEIDNTQTIASLLADLDAYDQAQGLSFYERVGSAFTKACRSIIFLRMYAVENRRLYGVSASRALAKPYSGDDIPGAPAPLEPPPINDEEAYHRNLMRWLDGDDAQRGDARQFFWAAFAGSEVVETIEEVERFGAGHQRMWRCEYRKAHQFLASTLFDTLSDSDFNGVVDLILSCFRGWPYPLAEILVRHGRNASIFRQWQICYALGEIGSSPHASAREFLEARTKSRSWPIRLQASLSLFKTFVKTEGLFRLNHRDRTSADYDALVDSLITPMSEPERMICLLAFASILSSPGVGVFSQPFQSNYAALQAKIETICSTLLKDDERKSKAATLKQLIQTNDYLGVCLMVVLDLDAGDQNPLYVALMNSCCDGSIACAGHIQASRHLSMCFYLKKQYRLAFEIADGLASQNPEWVDVQILAAQVLGDTPGAEDQAGHRLAGIRRAYKLTVDEEARLAAVEAEIARRNGGQ